ncbi:hypothetical protein [uncultured Prochlorococcus sp.]|nr:hypothetical protein [uncultured Prochlorococcus sp.]
MKLKTQFKVPIEDLRDFDYVKKMQTLEKALKQNCIYYPLEEDCLVYWN